MQLVGDLRELLASAQAPDAYVTGATAVSVDVAQSLESSLPVYPALVVGLALVLRILVFRSLLVPVVGVLGFLLSLGASLGATVAVFQRGWLSDAVNLDSTGPLLSLAPILVIGILFGLAMDYQVFLVSRMHEAHSHGASPINAIRTGFRQSAPVVVAAAAIRRLRPGGRDDDQVDRVCAGSRHSDGRVRGPDGARSRGAGASRALGMVVAARIAVVAHARCRRRRPGGSQGSWAAECERAGGAGLSRRALS